MGDAVKLMEKLKKEVRAVLLTSKSGLTVYELEKDYADMMSRPLPYRELGFGNVTDLCRSMSDVVSISMIRGKVVLVGIPDKATEHVARLVQGQKNSGRPRGRLAATRRPDRPMYRASNVQQFNSMPSNRVKHDTTLTVAPADLRARFHELLESKPEGIYMANISTAYQRKFGVPLLVSKYGFDSVLNLLRGMPDTVELVNLPEGGYTVYGRGRRTNALLSWRDQSSSAAASRPVRSGAIGKGIAQIESDTARNITVTDLHRHFRELLLAYPDGLSMGNIGFAYERRFGLQLTLSNYGFTSFKRMLKTMPDVVDLVDLPEGGYMVYVELRSESLPSSSDSTQLRGNNVADAAPTGSGGAVGKETRSFAEMVGVGHESNLKEDIARVLAKHPNGICAAELPMEFKRVTGKDLPMKEHGYYSVIDLVSAMSDTIYRTRLNTHGDWTLYDARMRPKIEKESKITSSTSNQYTRSSSPEGWQEMVRDVLLANPHGVLLHNLPGVYENMTGQELSVASHGFQSMEELVLSLRGSCAQIRMTDDGHSMVYGIAKPRPTRDVDRDTTTNSKLPLAIPRALPHPAHLTRKLPADSVGPGSNYKSSKLPKVDEYFTMYVSVMTPNGQVHFQRASMKKKLDELMDDLERTYTTVEGDAYAMPEMLFAIGQPCAAIFPEGEDWHRVLILGMPSIEYVEVLFIDYGNVCHVLRDNCRMLRARFLGPPAAAMLGRFANIVPVGSRTSWTNAAVNYTLGLVSNVELVGRIVSVDAVMACPCAVRV
ncbi:PREDICTED: tudor domain-containing protein 5-like [Priapulus caudatus]|uniref:Tudor domain-containing protein 5-like n=1 Tax=Priapulus caudatus TaxID=37621 RepID=A0ABM1DR93_PRICU|nr:PREDICTED: tudor domain-containing protein 5-like [Priapulus caudatus]